MKTLGNIQNMTQKEVSALPFLGWGATLPEFTSFAILPSRRLHDSGYRCMSYVLLQGDEIVGKIGGGSDHLQLYSVGHLLESHGAPGYETEGRAPMYNIDCLKKSGLLRFFLLEGRGRKLQAGPQCSSQSIY